MPSIGGIETRPPVPRTSWAGPSKSGGPNFANVGPQIAEIEDMVELDGRSIPSLATATTCRHHVGLRRCGLSNRNRRLQ